MKELSIEEKAKAYDESYKVAKNIHRFSSDIAEIKRMEEIFPELKESEDERIRKRIIEWIEEIRKCNPNNAEHNGDCSEAIAWLERQGEKDKLIKELGEYKVKYTQEVLEKYINSIGNKDDERLRKTTIAFLKDFAKQGYENAVECMDWLEKQGEQKPTNEVKPKFKVGDKIHRTAFAPKEAIVTEVCNGWYILNDKDVLNFDFEPNWELVEQKPADNVEPKFHKGEWVTIKE